jgi:CheY-like chemotaxis protein
VPRTLLLADDSVTIQRVIELTFADEDIRVVAVGDGDQAIAAIDRTPPDIVLADVGMPGRDGYEVAEYIRNTPHLAHIPVLLLTGAFEPIDQARAAQVRCDGVLAKPFEPQLVIGRVKELLSRPRGTAAAAASDGPASPSTAPAMSTPAAPAMSPAPAAPRTAISEEPPPAHTADPATAPAEVDRYFDRLDRAFASLSSHESHEAPSVAPLHGALSAAGEVDWFSTTPGEIDAPAAGATPDEPDLMLAPSPPAPAGALAVTELAPSPALMPLADAFAALLAAERSAPPPPSASWPIIPPPHMPQEQPVIAEAVIEEVVRRVLEHLSDRVVRETVADIVSDVAARLVREEIERIRDANI